MHPFAGGGLLRLFSTHPEHEEMLRRLGATTVVTPERAGAALLLDESARVLAVPVASQACVG